MGMFDAIPVAAPAARAAPAGMFDDIPVSAPAQKAPEPPAGRGFMGYASDVARSAETGADKGLVGLLGAPSDIAQGIAFVADHAKAYASGRPYEDVRAEANAHALVPTTTLAPYGADALYRRLSDSAGARIAPDHTPETTAGRYAKTAAEFGAQAVAFPGSMARNVLGYGVLPGLASEAAGQATEGTPIEPFARASAGLATGLGALGVGRLARPTAGDAVARATGDLAPAERQAALGRFDDLMASAKDSGIPLSPAFAYDAATGGASDMAGLYRHAEALGRMRGFNAQMPSAVEQAGRAQFDRISPLDTMPSLLGERASMTARDALGASPIGQDLAAARQAAGPRVTPFQAGQTIQGDLRAVQDARETTRSDQAARDYSAARGAPETVAMDRTVSVERPGEPLLQTIDNGPRPPLVYDRPPQGPDTIGDLKPTRPEAPLPQRDGPSLSRYIAENGGIGLERGDIRATGLERWRQPGVGSLVRQDGKSIDGHWREDLIAKGYLPPDGDGGAARGVSDELLGLLQQEQRGQRVYPYDWAGTEARQSHSRALDDYRYQSQRAAGDVASALQGAGFDKSSFEKGTLDRAAAFLMRGDEQDPLRAVERSVMAAREPASRGPTMREVPTTVTEEIEAPRWGQVDPRPAMAAVAEQSRTAKGDVRGALSAAGRDLREPGGDPDMSVAGLLHARERLDFGIRAAQEVGDATKVRDLQATRSALDGQLKQVPEVATADRNFAANSWPLEPFSGNAPLAQVTRQDPLTGRMAMPAEHVPGTLSGPSAARDALANGTSAAREALHGRLVTQIMDGATDFGGNVSADRIRSAMREHEDVLAQMPEAAERLNRVARAQDALDGLRGTVVGRLAARDQTTANAVKTLFPKGGDLLANGEREIGAAVGTLARQNPVVARQLVRAKAENLFNASTKDVQPGANQMGGAKFAAQLVGNPQEAANFVAAVRALPEGDTIADGFGRFLDVLKASGRRQNVGSRTAYNEEFLREAREGGPVEGAARLAAGGFLKLPAKIQDKLERWRLGRNVDELARLFSDPDAIGAFRGLVAAGERGGDIRGPVARLVAIAGRGATNASVRRDAR